ncbi:MAG: hypothetical protein ACJARR_004163 [Pseudophaeobacter arcticus]|jgi:hypothetical protein
MVCNISGAVSVKFQDIGCITPVIAAPELVIKQDEDGMASKNAPKGPAGVFVSRGMG